MFDVIKCCNICKKKLKELKIEVKVSILLKNINIKYGYCECCNYAQAINIPKNKILKSYYKNNSQWRRQLLTKEDKNHINKQIKFFSKYINFTGKKHLEIGPDMGHFLECLRSKYSGEQFFFQELNLFAKKFLKNSGFKEHRKEKVNSISLLHVFEHVSNPIKYLNSLKQILLPNGFIFIETPDYSEINKNNCDPFQFEHLSYFSLLSFVKIARKTGLIIETIERDQTQNYSTSPGRVIRLVLKKTTNLKNNSWNLLANSNLERLEQIKNLIKNYKKVGHKIAIYGAGTVTKQINLTFNLKGCIEKVYDSDQKKDGEILFGIPVTNSKKINNKHFTKMIILVMGYKKEVINFLKTKGIDRKKIYSVF